MTDILPILMIVAMVATLAVVVVGIISFAVHGKFYKENSNKLMRLRVLLQGLALILFALVAALGASG
jgi:hypothetical protein